MDVMIAVTIKENKHAALSVTMELSGGCFCARLIRVTGVLVEVHSFTHWVSL